MRHDIEATDKLMMIARTHQLGPSMEAKIQSLQERFPAGQLDATRNQDELPANSRENQILKAVQNQIDLLLLQKHALEIPLPQLNGSITEFKAYLLDIKSSEKKVADLLDTELKTILHYYNEMVDTMMNKVTSKLAEQTEQLFHLHKKNSPEEIKEVLEANLYKSVHEEIKFFQEVVGTTMERQFESTSYRFAARMEDLILKIYTKAAELMGFVWEMEAEVPRLEARRKLEYTIDAQWIFQDTSLDPHTSKIPGFISKQLICRSAKKRIPIEIDKICRQIRGHYLETLRSDAQQIRQIMHAMTEETFDEVSRQFEIAVQRKQDSGTDVEAQIAIIDQHIQELHSLSKPQPAAV